MQAKVERVLRCSPKKSIILLVVSLQNRLKEKSVMMMTKKRAVAYLGTQVPI